MKTFLAKQKVHLIFGTGFLIVPAINIIIALTEGQAIRSAIWNGLSAVRPGDYIMFGLFWYGCAVHRPKDSWDSPLISLNLSGTRTGK
jgi:hypothetical protein